MSATITLTPAPYVTIDLAESVTGLTVKGMRRKIEEGVWVDGKEYRRGPDGRIYISIEGFKKWVESAASMSGKRAFASRSPSTGNRSVAL